MYKPDETSNGRRLAALAGVSMVAIASLLVQLPIDASAGITTGGDDRVVPQAAATPSAPAEKPAGTYQLRCWQEGRLLFEEGPVTLPAEVRKDARLVVIDRRGSAVIVTDAGRSTCMARPTGAPPNPAMQQ